MTARKLLQTKFLDVEMSLRGMLRGFGLKVGPTTPRSFAGRVRELAEGHPTLAGIAEALPAARETFGEQLRGLEMRLRKAAREELIFWSDWRPLGRRWGKRPRPRETERVDHL